MVMKVNSLSKVVVLVMKELAKNDGIVRLLASNENNPFSDPEINVADWKKNMIKPKRADSKILPYPFDTEAKVSEGSFVRVYVNQGTFDEGETIMECDVLIDIVVAKSYWLIDNGNDELIRPYEIMDRVIDCIGRRAHRSDIRLKVEGFQHHYVNTKFDCIRLYCNRMSVETQNKSDGS